MRLVWIALILSFFSIGSLASPVRSIPCLYKLELAGEVTPETTQVSQFLYEQTGEDGVIKADVPTLLKGKPTLKSFILRILGKRAESSFVENTIELGYFDTASFGHINLRLGHFKVSFDGPGRATFKNFYTLNPLLTRPGQIGSPIVVPREKIDEAMVEIKKIYESSRDYNVPPMDSYGARVSLKNVDGQWQFATPTTDQYKANSDFKGKVFLDTPEPYILTPNGLTVPIIVKANGDLVVQSYSCSSSAAYILNRFFDIKIDGSSAKAIKRQILNHEIGPIINYTRQAL